MINDNKRSYFAIQIKIPPECTYSEENMSQAKLLIENQIDDVLERMCANPGEIHQVKKENGNELLYFFSTDKRKRVGSLRNLLNKKLSSLAIKDELESKCKSFVKSEFYNAIEKLRRKEGVQIHSEDQSYKGSDINVFKDRKNWYTWQENLHDMLFDENNQFKPSDDRKIIFIKCDNGCTGKSSFIKYLFIRSKDKIGALQDGSPGQLKSSIYNQGIKKCYLVDLPRTQLTNKESMLGLMNSLESLKNGFTTVMFRGAGTHMIMPNPWVVVFANKIPMGSFSLDRWLVWDLKRKKDDVINIDITSKIKKIALASIAIENEKQNKEEKFVIMEGNRIKNLVKK